MNLVVADVEGDVARFGSYAIPLDGSPGLAAYRGRKVALGIRPEDLEDAELVQTPAPAHLPVTVDLREDMGAEIYLHFLVDAPSVATAEVRDAFEDEAALEQPVTSGTPFVARVGRESGAREGERVEIAVDTRMLHFFDLETGEAISE